jgi:hypothetical protein
MRLIRKQSFIAMTTAATLLSGVVNAHAGPCGAQIAQFQKLSRSEIPTLPQKPSVELHHQPTASDVENAQNQAKAESAAALDRAQKADARGDGAVCNEAISELKKLYAIGGTATPSPK